MRFAQKVVIDHVRHQVVIDGPAERIHAEALRYLASVRDEPQHELRRSVDQWLEELVRDMREDPATRERVEQTKRELFDDPRMREWAGQAWAGQWEHQSYLAVPTTRGKAGSSESAEPAASNS